jgi:hypothetical protein
MLTEASKLRLQVAPIPSRSKILRSAVHRSLEPFVAYLHHTRQTYRLDLPYHTIKTLDFRLQARLIQ